MLDLSSSSESKEVLSFTSVVSLGATVVDSCICSTSVVASLGTLISASVDSSSAAIVVGSSTS